MTGERERMDGFGFFMIAVLFGILIILNHFL